MNDKKPKKKKLIKVLKRKTKKKTIFAFNNITLVGHIRHNLLDSSINTNYDERVIIVKFLRFRSRNKRKK